MACKSIMTESTCTRAAKIVFEGRDRLIRFVCGASWYLCLLSLAAASLSTRARRGKKAMHGNSVIEFAGALSLSATAVYEGNEDRALNGARWYNSTKC